MQDFRTALLAGTLLVLSACQAHTMGAMRERAPVLQADSQRSTIEIGSCLARAAEKNGGAANYVPNPEGATVTLEQAAFLGGATPMFNADIKDVGGTRHVSVWMFKTVWSDNNRHQVERFRACL